MIVRRPVSASPSAAWGEIQSESTDSCPSCSASWSCGAAAMKKRVEALGHHRRGDPVRERHQTVTGEQQVLALHERGKVRARHAAREELGAAALAREQDAALLERLADRRDAQGARVVVARE